MEAQAELFEDVNELKKKFAGMEQGLEKVKKEVKKGFDEVKEGFEEVKTEFKDELAELKSLLRNGDVKRNSSELFPLETTGEEPARTGKKFQPLSILKSHVPYKARLVAWLLAQGIDFVTDVLVAVVLMRGLRCGSGTVGNLKLFLLGLGLLLVSLVGFAAALIQFWWDSKKTKWRALRILVENVTSFGINMFVAYYYLDGFSPLQILSVCFSFLMMVIGMLASMQKVYLLPECSAANLRRLWRHVALLATAILGVVIAAAVILSTPGCSTDQLTLRVNGEVCNEAVFISEDDGDISRVFPTPVTRGDLTIVGKNNLRRSCSSEHNNWEWEFSVVNTTNRQIVNSEGNCTSSNVVVAWHIKFTSGSWTRDIIQMKVGSAGFAGVWCTNSEFVLGEDDSNVPEFLCGWSLSSAGYPCFNFTANAPEEGKIQEQASYSCLTEASYNEECTNVEQGESASRIAERVSVTPKTCEVAL